MATSSNNVALPDVVFGFADSAAPAQDFARHVGAAYRDVEVHAFPDGESRVTVPGTAQHPVFFRSLNQPNEKLIEVLLAGSVLRERGVRGITLIAPYLAYMRQDIAFHPGEAVSQKVIGSLLADMFDRFVSVDPHLHRVATLDAVFAGKPALSLTAAAHMAGHFLARPTSADALVVGPDVESGPVVEAFATAAGRSWTTALKVRHGDHDVRISLPPHMNVAGRPVVIVDDIISSGTTIMTMAKLVKAAGAPRVDVYTTHALFDQASGQAMIEAGVDHIFSCDSVSHPSNAIALAPLLAEGISKWR